MRTLALLAALASCVPSSQALRAPVDRLVGELTMLGGDGPHGTTDMGGMFTLLKIRGRLTGDGDPSWYEPPGAEVAGEATAGELARDGIVP